MRWSARLILVMAVTIIVILAISYEIHQKYLKKPTERKIIIYTYESLLKWGTDPNATLQAVYGGFEEKYGCEVEIREFDDARTALLALIQEKDAPKADVVIGIDNVLVHEAIEQGVLEPFTPSNIDEIPEWLVNSLDPKHHVIPYDYGLIALVYDSERISEGEMAGMTFERLLEPEFASKLVLEDPTVSSTGINFLLWQIAAYKMQGKDWTSWWELIKGEAMIAGSWGDAYDIFLDEAQGRPIVVSYGTDPAYSYHFYQETRYKAALVEYGGKKWAWLQIEGIGLVKGAPHRELAKKFIEYFLSPEVQKHIPLNNWMYPANSKTELPEVYLNYAIDPSNVSLMNEVLTQEEIRENLKSWLNSWREIVGG
mgnify:CR=1 FL=1